MTMSEYPGSPKQVLKNVDVVMPLRESVLSRRNLLAPTGQVLQQELSYPINDDDEDDEEGSTCTQPSERRPRVYIQTSTKSKPKLATYGFDMFFAAKINYKKPLLVVRQDMKTHDVIISSVESLDWVPTVKHNQEPQQDSDDAQDSLNIVPAGAFSYRHSAMGAAVRTLFRLNQAAMVPRKMLGKKFPPVRLAAVVIPRVKYKGETHLMITQRVHKKKGTYNNMYVFPGGHVEAGETLAEGAQREFEEETGLEMNVSSLKLVCCWEEVLPAKSLQFLMLVYSGDVSVPADRKSGEFEWDDLCLQKAEVATLALLPERTWEAMGTRGNCQDMLEAAHFERAEVGGKVQGQPQQQQGGGCNTEMKHIMVPANDVTGYGGRFGAGIGSGHRFALTQYVRPFDKDVMVSLGSFMNNNRHQGLGSRLSKMGGSMRSSTGLSTSSTALHDTTPPGSKHGGQLSIRLSVGGDIVGLSKSLETLVDDMNDVNPSFRKNDVNPSFDSRHRGASL